MAEIIPRFDYRIECTVVEDRGRLRESHEDAHLIAPELGVFAVADGMGGHAAGEIAARLSIEEVRHSIAGKSSQRVIERYVGRPDLETRRRVFQRIVRAFEHANQCVRRDGEQNADHRGMGTTLDVVWLARDHAFIGHAGDGRIYLARPRAMLQLTQDHEQTEPSRGRPSLKRPRAGGRLMNAVGVNESISVDTLFVDVNRGDRLLLCTDGVHGQLDSENEIAELLRREKPGDAARALVARAAERGRDNATALIIEIGERFVKRGARDRGLAAADLERARSSFLLVDLPQSLVLATLSAAVEIELEPGAPLPRVFASDLVSYIVIDGVVRCPGSRRVSTGALLHPESLVGIWGDTESPVVEQRARVLRLRADDFIEVCDGDAELAAQLYRRLAQHLARSAGHVARARNASRPDGVSNDTSGDG